MNDFIETADGWINLSFVAEFREQGERLFALDKEGRQTLLPRHADLNAIIMKTGHVVPADKGFSIVYFGFDGDGFWHSEETIIAFRVNSLGLIPISPDGSPSTWGSFVEGWGIKCPDGRITVSDDLTVDDLVRLEAVMIKRRESLDTKVVK